LWPAGDAVYAFKQANLESLLNSAPSPSRPTDQPSETVEHPTPSSSAAETQAPPKRAQLEVVSDTGVN